MALVLLVTPAMADSSQFREIRTKDTVTLVLPDSECDATVVSRNLNQLTLRLKKKTAGCGERQALVALSRVSVSDVLDNKRRTAHDPGRSRAAFCGHTALALVGAPGALAVAQSSGSGPLGLLVLFGSAAGGAVLCRDRGTHYTVFSDEIVPAQHP